jgi:hypothetical protein
MPPVKTSRTGAKPKSKSKAAPKKRPGRPRSSQSKSKPKKKAPVDKRKKPKAIYYEDYVSESSDSADSAEDSGDSAPPAKKSKKSKSDFKFDKSGVESPRIYDLFYGKPEVNANADRVRATFTPEEDHVSQMYAGNPVLQSQVYNCAVENGFGDVETISRFKSNTTLSGTPGIVAATIDFLTARRKALTSGSVIEEKFSDDTFDLLDGGIGLMMRRLAPWKNKEETPKTLKLSLLGYDGSVEKFPHFLACIFAALDGPVRDSTDFGNLRNQLKACCADILRDRIKKKDRSKEFCYHFGRKLVEQLWKHSLLTGKAFGEKVPSAVQLAFSLVNPVFFEEKESESQPGKKGDPAAGTDRKDYSGDRFRELQKMPGWIPQKIYKTMSKAEIGKFACPFFIRSETCTNDKCPYGHSKSLPLYVNKD